MFDHISRYNGPAKLIHKTKRLIVKSVYNHWLSLDFILYITTKIQFSKCLYGTVYFSNYYDKDNSSLFSKLFPQGKGH